MFKQGDIVTVMEPESTRHEEQGRVAEVQLCFWEPPEVLVCFDRERPLSYLTLEPPAIDSRVYRPNQLRRDDDWRPEVYADRLFRDRWHHISCHPEALDPAKPCMHADCPELQAEVVWINIWGSVFNVYVCPGHAKHHRRYPCMDSFPFRQNTQEAVA